LPCHSLILLCRCEITDPPSSKALDRNKPYYIVNEEVIAYHAARGCVA
jgi:hypothetical protein